MAKARIGHLVWTQVVEASEVDCIGEFEIIAVADEVSYIDSTHFKVPFVC